MSQQDSSVGKWLAGILATIISGVAIYHFTTGRTAPSSQSVISSSLASSTKEEAAKPKIEIRQPESSKLVGTWRATGVELGQPYDITWHVRPDGTTTYFISDGYEDVRMDGAWQYSDGILYETYSNGSSGKGAVDIININYFVITIIDNGTPAYTGIKRHYYRQ